MIGWLDRFEYGDLLVVRWVPHVPVPCKRNKRRGYGRH